MNSLSHMLKNGLRPKTISSKAAHTKELPFIRLIQRESRDKISSSKPSHFLGRPKSKSVSHVKSAEEKRRKSTVITVSQGSNTNRKSVKRSVFITNTKRARSPSTNTARAKGNMKHKSIMTSDMHYKNMKRKSSQRQPEQLGGLRRYFGSFSKTIDITAGTSKVCDAQHDGRVMMRQNFDIRVDVVFNMLFASTSSFLHNFHDRRKSTGLCLGKWKLNMDGTQVRVVNVTVALQSNVGPKTSKITESHTLRSCSVPGELYAIDVESINEGIPYADVFNIATHYCLSRLSNNNTEVLVLCNVNFIKSTWAVVRAFIVKHTYEGLAEFFQDLTKQLQQEAAKTEGKLNAQYK